MYFTTLFV